MISGIEAACASASALSCTFSSVAGRSFAARESMICCVTTGLPVISSNCSFVSVPPMEDTSTPAFARAALILSVTVIIVWLSASEMENPSSSIFFKSSVEVVFATTAISLLRACPEEISCPAIFSATVFSSCPCFAGLEYVAMSIFPASDTAVFCCT